MAGADQKLDMSLDDLIKVAKAKGAKKKKATPAKPAGAGASKKGKKKGVAVGQNKPSVKLGVAKKAGGGVKKASARPGQQRVRQRGGERAGRRSACSVCERARAASARCFAHTHSAPAASFRN